MKIDDAYKEIERFERIRPIPAEVEMYRNDIRQDTITEIYHHLGKDRSDKYLSDLIFSMYCMVRRRYVRRSQRNWGIPIPTSERMDVFNDVEFLMGELKKRATSQEYKAYEMKSQGYSHKEIAEKLKTTEGYSRNMVSRAKEIMRSIGRRHGYCK